MKVADDRLWVMLSGFERFGAFKGDFSFPTDSIESAEYVGQVRKRARGLRAFGTGFPGWIALGRWRHSGRTDFVAAYRNESGYVITLRGQAYRRLIVSSPRLPELDRISR
jgi:hypothetical protein